MGESGETLDLCGFDAGDEPLFRPRGVQAWFPDQLAPSRPSRLPSVPRPQSSPAASGGTM